jgi:hypothetical protein
MLPRRLKPVGLRLCATPECRAVKRSRLGVARVVALVDDRDGPLPGQLQRASTPCSPRYVLSPAQLVRRMQRLAWRLRSPVRGRVTVPCAPCDRV